MECRYLTTAVVIVLLYRNYYNIFIIISHSRLQNTISLIKYFLSKISFVKKIKNNFKKSYFVTW